MKLLAIDGNSILNRAFYGIKLLTTKKGEYTNAVYGFLTMMSKILADTNPNAVAIAFDRREPTFRHKKYDGYKANRHGMPEELASQLPLIKEILQYLGYHIVECSGYEADDILGTLARECENTGNKCIVATGDRDSLQLISEAVNVRLITTKNVVTYDNAKILEEYGVTPKQLIDVKAIQGDTSDNIPGVKGIGPKGAIDLISRFNDLDYIYENLDTIDIKPAVRKKLTESKDSAYLSRFLGEISREAPIEKNIEEYIPLPVDNPKAYGIMARLELFSLIEKFGIVVSSDIEISDKETQDITKSFSYIGKITAEQLDEKLKNIESLTFLISDVAPTLFSSSIISVCFENEICTADYNEFSAKVIAECQCNKITNGIKPFYSMLEKMNIDEKGEFSDTQLMAYLLNPSASDYDVERLSAEYFVEEINIEFADYSVDEVTEKLVNNTAILFDIYDKLNNKIVQNNQQKLFKEIEMPLAKVLVSMENQGFMADKEGIEAFGEMLAERIADIQKTIHEEVGYEFNINSPKQLGVALFEKLGLPIIKKTKSGYSTNAEVLEQLAGEYPIAEKIIDYRHLAKLKSTYCDGMIKVIGADGRIHSSFNQTETRTGRISSTEPNLQNIPVRTELGREMRKFFIAKEGYVLIDADYSQIELRVLAHIANDKAMIEAFKNGDDIHSITASQVFGNGIPTELITPSMRSRAKAVNFGIVYGIGAFSLSKDINVTVREAGRYIENYLNHYKGVQKYMESVIAEAKDKGYVETMFNRRRYLPELNSSNKNMRSFGERVARNMPIQGTSADIIKIAMIKVFNRLKAENLKAKLILQVHDELIVEAPIDEQEKVKALLQQEMENAVKLIVPLTADANCGKSWYDAKG